MKKKKKNSKPLTSCRARARTHIIAHTKELNGAEQLEKHMRLGAKCEWRNEPNHHFIVVFSTCLWRTIRERNEMNVIVFFFFFCVRLALAMVKWDSIFVCTERAKSRVYRPIKKYTNMYIIIIEMINSTQAMSLWWVNERTRTRSLICMIRYMYLQQPNIKNKTCDSSMVSGCKLDKGKLAHEHSTLPADRSAQYDWIDFVLRRLCPASFVTVRRKLIIICNKILLEWYRRFGVSLSIQSTSV